MNIETFVPDETQKHILNEQLASGETVQWLGKEPHSRYISNRILGVAGSLFVALFAGFFTVLMLVMNPNVFQGSFQGFVPVLIPFAIFAVGMYSLVRSILSLTRGHPTLYAITDRRAILIEQGVKVEIKSYGSDAINAMQVTRHKNGSGKIIFERQNSWVQDGEGRAQRRVVEIGFYGVSSVDEICRLLRMIPQAESVLQVGGEALSGAEKFATDISDHFFALETSALHERLYKISVISGQVCGAKISGGLSSAGLKHMGSVSGYGFLFSPFADQMAKGERKRETYYSNINMLGPDFLTADKANFRYGALETDHIVVYEEYKTLESGYNASGRLEIHLQDGKIRKFWLTRNANPTAVEELFRTNGLRVEQVGEKT